MFRTFIVVNSQKQLGVGDTLNAILGPVTLNHVTYLIPLLSEGLKRAYTPGE
jgi:hypothetical protein